ncbi:MAG: DUF2207 domain-containing protein [Bacilli bacterium]|nr:DUF2207 domain-containing protein [Bacilli bacterium]
MKKTEENLGKKTALFTFKWLLITSMIPLSLLIIVSITGVHKSGTLNFIFILMFCLLFFPAIGALKGYKKANKEIIKEEKQIKLDNPYMYFRELPNKFGIGVSSILMDSAIEDYKDIVAVILDLCAKKYLFLRQENNQYKIDILKNIDNNLLNNEKYVMECIINKSLNTFDYKYWYKLCVEDSYNFGIYYKNDSINLFAESTKDKLTANIVLKKYFKILILSSGILAILSALESPWYLLTIFMWMFILAVPEYLIMNIVFMAKRVHKASEDIKNKSYKQILNDKLVKTEKGKEELQKLYAFESFIKDFKNFVDKKPEEVILWDYYLSYAVMFGATKDILKDGYANIIKNGSFILNDVDAINLNNIITNEISN